MKIGGKNALPGFIFLSPAKKLRAIEMMHTPSITRFVKDWILELFIANLSRLTSCATVAIWLLIVWGIVWGMAEYGAMR